MGSHMWGFCSLGQHWAGCFEATGLGFAIAGEWMGWDGMSLNPPRLCLVISICHVEVVLLEGKAPVQTVYEAVIKCKSQYVKSMS